MVAARQKVELLEKNKPRQERAKRTYESILAAAAELLVEVGVERISTNIIAERAGITDFERVYTRDEMVTQDVIFAATGVTGGSLLPAIKRTPGWLETTTLLMRSKSGSVRRMTYRTPAE